MRGYNSAALSLTLRRMKSFDLPKTIALMKKVTEMRSLGVNSHCFGYY